MTSYEERQNRVVELMICGGTVQKETGSIFGTSIDSNYNVLTPTMDKASLKGIILKNVRLHDLTVEEKT